VAALPEEMVAMKTVLQILTVVTLGYLFWVFGLPWLQREVGRSGPPVGNPAKGKGGECVQAVAKASDRLHDDILEHGRMLEDDGEWNRVVEGVDDALHQARFSCDCRLQSCVASREALARLSSVFQATRDQIRTSQSIPLDQARDYERANEMLWEAYDLARDEK
jgi:hypothetical protein